MYPPCYTTFVIGKVTQTQIIIFLAVVIIGILAVKYRDEVVVASVNGEYITRMQVIKELEDQAAADTLDSLVTETLLFQEAERQGIAISDETVDQEITEIESSFVDQGQELATYLESQRISDVAFRRQVKLQIILEQLLADRIEVTVDEIDTYISENAEFFGDEDTSTEVFRNDIRDQLESQKSATEVQVLIQELRDNADVTYFKTY